MLWLSHHIPSCPSFFLFLVWEVRTDQSIPSYPTYSSKFGDFDTRK
jgi:hypothetical protein